MSATKRFWFCAGILSAASLSQTAHAVTFELPVGDGLAGTLNTTMTLGAGLRMQDRASDLVGKSNLDPGVCGGIAQSCQGAFKEQTHPARTLARSPGAAYLNADDGNLNYDRHDTTQAVFKLTQDVTLSYGDFGVFAKWLYFYDFVNNDFIEHHPNMVTAANRGSVGCTTPVGSGGCNATTFDRAYGPGAPVDTARTDDEVLRQVGTDLQMFDYYFYGQLPLPWGEDKNLTFKVGNQTLNWGESTALVINSINQVNPVNANNLMRVGFDLAELFTPTGMVFLSLEPFEGATIEAFYGYEWQPVEIPAPGSFFSFADAGTNNAVDYASISFGGQAEDPEICPTGAPPAGVDAAFDYYNPGSGCASPQNNPLAGLTNTSLTTRRVSDNEARDDGQFGVSFKYFADWLNNGTELAFYFMNYHSKLPYVSFYSTQASCARAEGNAMGQDATDGGQLFSLCNDVDTIQPSDLPSGQATAAGARTATRSVAPIDTVRFQLEYPEDIQMYGFSFNTTVGDISLQGEIAFRPDMPLQVDTQDLTFHALGPMLGRCHTPAAGCAGTVTGTSAVDGVSYDTPSDFTPYPGTGIAAFTDTFDLLIGGAGVGSARAFPSFIGAYRGVAAGETPPESYIRGWEEFDVWQGNLGATYVQGATDNVIGADQLIWLFEVGAQYVPDLPDVSVLQIEAPGTYYHASAGADGTMTGNYAQDCAHTLDCNYNGYNPRTGEFFSDAGDPHPCTAAVLAATTPANSRGCGDGLRFNPHQEPSDGFADAFSWGYVIVSLIRYESVLPGVSIAPFTLFQHDVKGTSTDVAAQFTESRKDIAFALEIRYLESLSITPGYIWSTGGGRYNLQRDRDQLYAFVKYLF
ncbi:MAG: DUF1302 domain-containing protein [Nevskiaceae bacterium]